jgi:hypothetical protein
LDARRVASGVTAQPVETVIAVLEAHRNGASINAAAKASGINYRTAQRIVEAEWCADNGNSWRFADGPFRPTLSGRRTNAPGVG